MLQQDKELLFKDISARLPYRTMVKCITDYHHEFDEELSDIHIMNFYQFDVKPYLRPMSSMTDEEIKDLQKINCQFCFNKFDNFAYVGAADDGFCSVEEMCNILDYLNSHHFDYRGLIEKGLALEAPEGMY